MCIVSVLVMTSSSVSVSYEPKIVEGPANRTAREGWVVEFTCKVSNMPVSKIQWQRNRKFVNYTERVKRTSTGGLRIVEVLCSDSGMYRCVASTAVSNEALLNVTCDGK